MENINLQPSENPLNKAKSLNLNDFVNKETSKTKKLSYMMAFGDMTIQYDFSLN